MAYCSKAIDVVTKTEMTTLEFRINDTIVSVNIPNIENELYYQLTSDNEYTVAYLKHLINIGEINIGKASEYEIFRRTKEGEIRISDTKLIAGHKLTSEWTEESTKLLLDHYAILLNEVGPMKRLRTKKAMWEEIAHILNKTLGGTFTHIQVENRYKTVLKRKRAAVENNSQTGGEREDIQFEEELQKIAAIDDSIEPEVKRSANSAIQKNTNKENKKKKIKSSQETLIDLLKEKEATRERRHKEKLDLLKELFNKN